MSEREDCWNDIGVTGDRSCGELTLHTHCRNCPSYAAAAATRLDRPLPEDSIATATAYYAAPRQIEEVVATSCFVFRLGAEWLALPTALLDEVISTKPTHAIPPRRGATRVGLVSVRGDIIVHLSLAGLLGIADDAAAASAPNEHRNSAPRVVVLADARGRLAFSVDEVMGFHRYDANVLRPVPSTLGQALNSYTTAMISIGDRVVGMLDGARVSSSLALALA